MGFYRDRVLPRIIDVAMNTEQTRQTRARVCAGLSGEIVEVGFGTGHNAPFLPRDVTQVFAVEPSERSVALAAKRIAASSAAIDVVGIDGERLELPDACADAVLCTWSLCTIPDPVAAVREMRRVLKPAGRLHFAEHGRAPDARVRRWQRRLNPLQSRVAGGCNLDRDIPAIIESAGLTVTSLDTYYAKGEPKMLGFTYEGVAAVLVSP